MIARTITLPDANTNYALSTLIAAVSAVLSFFLFEMEIIADAANTQPVLIGDETLSAGEYLKSLAAGASHKEEATGPGDLIYASKWYLRSSAAGQKVKLKARFR